MSRQFPGAQIPEFGETSGLIAYSYMNTEAEFTTPFADTLACPRKLVQLL